MATLTLKIIVFGLMIQIDRWQCVFWGTCADPDRIFVRGGGGGGGLGQSDKKSSDLFFFFFFFCFYYSSAYFTDFTEVKCLILEKTIIFEGSKGSPTFSRGGGGPTFIPYRNPYNL